MPLTALVSVGGSDFASSSARKITALLSTMMDPPMVNRLSGLPRLATLLILLFFTHPDYELPAGIAIPRPSTLGWGRRTVALTSTSSPCCSRRSRRLGAGAARSAAGLLFIACRRACPPRRGYGTARGTIYCRTVSFTNQLIKEGRTHLPGRHLVRAVDVDEAARHGTDAAPAVGHPPAHEGRLDAS